MIVKLLASAAFASTLAVSGAAFAQDTAATDTAPAATDAATAPTGDVSAQPGVQEPAVVPGTNAPPVVGTSGAVGAPTDAAMAPAATTETEDDDGFPWGLLGLLGLAGLLGLKRRDDDRTTTTR